MIWILGSRGIPARYGGFETLAEQLQRGLREQGLPTTVIGTRDAAVQRSLAARCIRFARLWALETPVLTWCSRPKVGPDDVVLVLNPVNVWTARRLQRDTDQVLLHLDGLEHLRGKWGRVARFVHRAARRSAARSALTLIADHIEIQRCYHEDFGRPTVHLSYGGCVLAEREPTHRWHPGQANDFFLVMARPEPENQVLEICEAFARSEADARLVVVGGPNRPTDYWRRIELTAASDPRIELRGPVWDRTELCRLMTTTRAYVHGHTVGGTNPSLVDVLSHQTPVFAHDNVFNRGVAQDAAMYWSSGDDLCLLLSADRQPVPANRPASITTWAEVVEDAVALLRGRRTPDSSPDA